jgi:hypothetical protein
MTRRSLTETAELELGNPAGLTPLDLATASMLGEEGCDPLPRPARDLSLDETLFDLIEPALAGGRCLVSFSGGRESAFVLAAATAAARARGYADPIPATLRYPLASSAREAKHQERIVAHLGLRDWERIEIHDELEIVGPYARRALREVGVLFPVTAYVLLPLLDLARGGWLLAGGGATDFFAYWRWARLADVVARRRQPRARDLRQLAVAAMPARARAALLRSRNRPGGAPWLQEEAAREFEHLVHSRAVDVPVRFGAALARQRRHRCYRGVRRGFDALCASTGTQVLMPFRSDQYLAALAVRGGKTGFGDRSETMLQLAGPSLSADHVRRSDGVNEQRVLFGERALAFGERWSGEGVDPEVVDPEVLQALWRGQTPPWGTSMLFQLAFAHAEAFAGQGRKKVQGPLTAVGGAGQFERVEFNGESDDGQESRYAGAA